MKKYLATLITLAGLLTPTLFAHADITSNLVGWYKLDEGSGSTAIDSSGNSNTGTEVNSPTYVAGKIGPYALSFNGTNQYVSTTNIVNTPVSTVSAWIYIISSPTASTVVAGFINGSDHATYDKDLYIGTDGKIYFYIYDSNLKTTSTPASAIPTNQWVMVTGTQDGTTAYAYVNGVQVGSVAAGNSYTGYSQPDLMISNNTSNFTGFFSGREDDVRFYSRALSASDVTQLYAYTGITSNNIFRIAKGAVFRIAKGAIFSVY